MYICTTVAKHEVKIDRIKRTCMEKLQQMLVSTFKELTKIGIKEKNTENTNDI